MTDSAAQLVESRTWEIGWAALSKENCSSNFLDRERFKSITIRPATQTNYSALHSTNNWFSIYRRCSKEGKLLILRQYRYLLPIFALAVSPSRWMDHHAAYHNLWLQMPLFRHKWNALLDELFPRIIFVRNGRRRCGWDSMRITRLHQVSRRVLDSIVCPYRMELNRFAANE